MVSTHSFTPPRSGMSRAPFAVATWKALEAATDALPLAAFDPATLDSLPAPAQRYLTDALPPGTPLSRVVELQMCGEIQLGGRWLPFTAEQILRGGSGFVWNAVVGGRLIRFTGADALGPDEARMEFRLHGLIPIVRAKGHDVRRSAQGRLAAETVVWLPQALTPQAGARWIGLDDERATVTISADGADVDVDVAVDPDGQLRWLSLQRWNSSSKPPAATTFGGSVDTIYTTPTGVRIAGSGTVGWDWHPNAPDDGVFFRYRVTTATFSGTSSLRTDTP